MLIPSGKLFSTPAIAVLIGILFLFSLVSQAENDNHPHFPDGQIFLIGEILLTGNKITKDEIIFREIIFSKGDTLAGKQLTEVLIQSKINLLNTALFNFVEFETAIDDSEFPVVDITFSFIERWYIWPVPIVLLGDRNFNEWVQTLDFSRLSYGFFLNHDNFRGRRELLQTLFLIGYNQSVGLLYQTPNLNKSQTMGMGFALQYNRQHEMAYDTKNDKLAYFEDQEGYPIRSFITNAMFFHRPYIHQSHSVWLQFNSFRFADTISMLNPDYFPGKTSSPYFLSLKYEFRNDHRNHKFYPTSGYLLSLFLQKNGLGIIQNSDLNTLTITGRYHKFLPLHKRWYLMAGANITAYYGSGMPYFLKPSLGYLKDYVRGYELYVINGQLTSLLKSNLKFRLLAPKTFDLPLIPTERFSKIHLALYLGIHSDVGYVYEPLNNTQNQNVLPNSFLWGNGIGLDLVTYYDKVLRLEYTLNYLGESGFFLHFVAPI